MFKNTFAKISKMIGDDDITNQDLLAKVEGAFYAYAYSGSPMLKASTKEIEDLLYGANTMAKRVAAMKINPEYSHRTLIKMLSTQIDKKTYNGEGEVTGIAPDFVSVFASKNKNRKFADDLWNDWNKFLTSPDPKEAAFGRDLIKASFYMSGFQKNIFSFFDSIPTEYMTNPQKEGNFKLYLENLLVDLDKGGVSEMFIEQFFQHNINSKVGYKKLVPKLDVDNKSYSANYTVFTVKTEDLNHEVKTDQGLMSYVQIDKILWRFEGYTNLSGSHAVYSKVPVAGYSQGGRYVYEYAVGREVESIITGTSKTRGVRPEVIAPHLVETNFLKYRNIGNDFAKLKDFDISISVTEVPGGFQVVAKDTVGGSANLGPVNKTKDGAVDFMKDFLNRNTNSTFTNVYKHLLDCFK
jgi:hypothetical protein